MYYLCYYWKWRDEVKKYLFFVMFLCFIIFSGCNNLSDNSNSVQNYEQTFNDLDEEITELDGYIVDSNINEDVEDGSKNGHITARIPQEDFNSFIKTVEEGSSKVLESSTSGEDVTEEYVDLESR